MAASQADRYDLARSERVAWLNALVAATTQIYFGTLVMYNATGYLVPALDTAGCAFAGLSLQNVNNTGADGALSCQFMPPSELGYLTLNASGTAAIATWLGRSVYIVDDNTVALIGTTTHDIKCGVCREVISTTKVLVEISRDACVAAD